MNLLLNFWTRLLMKLLISYTLSLTINLFNLKVLFNRFFQAVDILMEHSMDTLQISTMPDFREMCERYKKQLFELFVRIGAIIVRYFQLNVNSNFFISLCEDLRPDLDYNNTYLKIIVTFIDFFCVLVSRP